MHARPFRPVSIPARLLHFAFATDHAGAERDREALIRFCEERGVPAPAAGAKQHVAKLGDAVLRWEQHGEFTTYTLDVEVTELGLFSPGAATLAHPMSLRATGAASRLGRSADPAADSVLTASVPFDPSSLCHSRVDDGGATLSTDLKTGVDGFIRYLIMTTSVDPSRMGALAQQTLELEPTARWRCSACRRRSS